MSCGGRIGSPPPAAHPCRAGQRLAGSAKLARNGMRIFFDDAQFGHRPTQFMVAGRLAPPVETPDRPRALVDALAGMGLARETPPDAGLAPILKVHAEHYVAFLSGVF